MSRSSDPAIDWQQLRALLRAYFQMSARGAVLFRSRGKPTTLVWVLVAYTLVGAGMGAFALAVHPSILLDSIALHSITFFVVGMSAVIESNDVLFDPEEDEILLHRPIPPRTLLAAKGLALVGFTLLLATALNLFPTFALLAAQGARPWIPLVHIASTLLLVVFVSAAVVCCYGIILRFFGREKFESLAVVAQVGATLVFVVGAQVIPRVVERLGPERIDQIAHYLLPSPPAWFASMDAVLGGGQFEPPLLLAAGAGILGTILLAWIGVGKLAEGYGSLIPLRGLVPGSQAQSSESSARTPAVQIGARSEGRSILRLWMRDPIEWRSFQLAAAYMRRDREVKLRVYSSMSTFVVFVAMSLLDAGRRSAQFFPMMMIAMAGTIPLTVMETMRMSSHFAAAEVFRAAPLASASAVFHGVRKATILFVQVPIVLAAVLLVVFRAGAGRWNPEIAIPMLLALPTLSLAPGLFGSYLPLSMAPRRGRQSAQNVGTVLLTLLLAGGVFGASYLAWTAGYLWYLVAVEFVVVVILHRALIGVIGRRVLYPWSEE